MENKNYYPGLDYKKGDRWCPIPSHEQMLQTVVAEPFVQAVDHCVDIEGLHFNRRGSILYFVNCPENKVCQIDMATKKVSVVCEVNRYAPGTYIAAVKVHKDGRLFIPYLNEAHDDGGIFYINSDGSGFTQIEIARGIIADDMVFDSKGGIYVTDMCGHPTDLKGTIEYITPDFKNRYTVIDNLATPNGIALSTDESVLWLADTTCGTVMRTGLTADGLHKTEMNQMVVYKTTGFLGPDSIVVDNDDNVYNALYFQGRVLVFNQFGFPIGQVLMPGRDEGSNLRTTHPCVRPGTRELYVCTNDDNNQGAWIMKCGSFAEANTHGFYRQL